MDDATEIDRLRAGIEAIHAWLSRVAAYELFLSEESVVSWRDKCDELLKELE